MKPIKFFINNIGVTIGLLAVATVAVYAQTSWSGPTATPPGNNTPAPLNVSAIDQQKDGGLGVGRLAVFGDAILSGSVGIGGDFVTGSPAPLPAYQLDVRGSGPKGGYINAATALCIAGDCRTSWPSGSAPSPIPAPAPVFVVDAGESALRVIRGVVGISGVNPVVMRGGSGFGVTRDPNHRGRYYINFTQPFNDLPAFTVNAVSVGRYAQVFCYISTGNLCTAPVPFGAPPYYSVLIQVLDSGSSEVDSPFTFTAIGKP